MQGMPERCDKAELCKKQRLLCETETWILRQEAIREGDKMTVFELSELENVSLNTAALLLTDSDLPIPESMDVSDVSVFFNISLNGASVLMKIDWLLQWKENLYDQTKDDQQAWTEDNLVSEEQQERSSGRTRATRSPLYVP